MYREGSKLAIVYDAFKSGGIDAAMKKCVEIGLSISTLKIQVKRKNWGGDAPVVIENSAKVARKSRTAESTKPRFRLTKKKDARMFIIIEQGPQVSLCRWIDSGEDQAMPNSWLIPAGSP